MVPRQKFDPSLLPERPDLAFEQALWRAGAAFVAGVDEAGRGALAGPVAVGAVVLPAGQVSLYDRLHGVLDSKVMTAANREAWAASIKTIVDAWGVGLASAPEIDRLGILPATCLAASRALAKLHVPVDHILVDYITLPNISLAQTALIKGDARSLSIACAAILAKTTRDGLMVALDKSFPGYCLASNKGYGTRAHRQAIAQLGPCDQHRRSFAPISDYYGLFPPQG